MSTGRDMNTSENEDICVVCCKKTDIYAVGSCDHPVCYECSTRMRVLCKQNECPICRQDMPKVIFTECKDLFANINHELSMQRTLILQDKYAGLFFASPSLQRAFNALLEHKCPLCKDRKDKRWTNFKNFNDLKEHMRKDHELFYCELCVANLKIFTSERRCYTRQELALHRRKGDLDNKSHRGHPLCKFCDVRYMDNDELYRHLRRDHYYCHFCDADGLNNKYYESYEDLRAHFLQEHFLCEEGNCRTEQFTSVFRTQIDLKAHQASMHSRDLGKSGTKQARTVEVAFTLTPRPGLVQHRRQNRGERNRQDDEDGAMGFDNFYTEPGGNFPRDQQRMVDPMNVAEFPQLGGNGEHVAQSRPTSTVTFTKITSKPLSGEDFPTLGNPVHSSNRPSNVTITAHSKVLQKGMPEVSITRTSKNRPNFLMHPQNFPSLGGNTGTSHSTVVSGPTSGNSTVRLSISSNTPSVRAPHPQPNVSIQINNVPMSSTIQVRPKGSDFPALGNTSAPTMPQWVQPKSKKQNQQQKQNGTASHKVNPAPTLPPSSLTDFPVLPKGNNDGKTKKRSSVTVPVLNSWVNLNSFNSENRNNVQYGATTRNEGEVDGEIGQPEKHKKGKRDQNHHKQPKSDSKKKFEKNERVKKKKKGDSEDSDGNITEDFNKNEQYNNMEYSKNGMVKKLSELKINSLINVNGNLNDNTDETSSSRGNEKSPVMSSAPPGFNVRPPPGFDNMYVDVNNLSLSNDLTFTNSSGQSFPILPTHTEKTYRPPMNFDKRNESLIKNFNEITKDNAAIMEFKNFSTLFRQGKYPAQNYYQLCSETMGACFPKLFPELLVLLPDITKQQDLYKEHLKLCSGNPKDLQVCLTCNQVLAPRDLSAHISTHTLENNFPVLSQPEQATLPNHWKK